MISIGRCIGLLVALVHCAGVFAAPEFPSLAVPANGSKALQIISPTVLEVMAVIPGSAKPPPDGPFPPPEVPKLPAGDFTVTVDGAKAAVRATGFRRRAVYAPLKPRDLRIGNYIYLQLDAPVKDGQSVEVKYKGSVPWLANLQVAAKMDPLRLGPAIHINQAGYAPDLTKTALVGYYLGTLNELPAPAPAEFHLVDARSGTTVHRGKLAPQPARGMPQPWYLQLVAADFTDFRTPGEYRLVVPGHGASYPFFIHAGIYGTFARTYALGLYHQRCGAPNVLPFTRYTHDACHTAPAEISPRPIRSYKGLEEAATDADIFPFVRKGKVDVSGGHHDAGDYSKYTINSSGLVHQLLFAVDNFPGVAALDNLGLPESGDGIGDLLQIVKWESDFLAKMQDEDGGFYFLVYPRDRRYEGDVLPDRGDPQIVWPKNSAGTAGAVAALAQCASSPEFRKRHPEVAKQYLHQAMRGWEFLAAAEQQRGRGKIYRKFTHYGELFDDADEIAWALCELYLATGEAKFEKELWARFTPKDPNTRHYGWRHLSVGYGNAIRSYAFAARNGRVKPQALDRAKLKLCEDEIITCADNWVRDARDSGYGTSYPEPTKRVMAGGWYFSMDQAFDLAVAAQLEFPAMADRRPAYRDAVISNLNYEAGCNPVNVSYLTGVGWKRPVEIVHQYAQNDRRILPLAGIPLGNIQQGFAWFAVYKSEPGAHTFPPDGDKNNAYPILDRWGESFNLQTEFVVLNQARGLATAAWLMAQSPLREQQWKAAQGEIVGAAAAAKLNQPLTLRLNTPGLDLADARIVWEGREHPPAYGREFTFSPQQPGEQWVEAEALWPDGRRVVAVTAFSVAK